MVRWIHSDDCSTVDNDHKEMVRVYRDKVNDDDDEEPIAYEQHPRRYPNDTKETLYKLFLQSDAYGEMKTKHIEEEVRKRRKKAVSRVNGMHKRKVSVISVIFTNI
jgi:hypothetical protein